MKAFASICKRKQWLIIASLCFVSNPLLANEEWVDSEYTSKFSAYVDTKSIMREKEFAVVRILKNYVMTQTEDEMQAYRSMVTLTIYEWSPVNPGTIQEAFMEYACDGMPAMPITRVRYLGLLSK